MTFDTDKGTNVLVSFDWDDFSSDITAIHFHKGKAGEDGPVIWTMPLKNMAPFGVTEDWTPTKQDIEDLKAGLIYCDIHSKQHSQGELRCQLIAPPE